MRNTKNEVLISPGNRHILEILLASVFYAVLLFLIVRTIFYYFQTGNIAFLLENTIRTITVSGTLIVFGLKFSMVKDILINVKDQYLISSYRVGRFKYDVKSKLPDLKYISIFKNATNEFEANLWYGKNNHYKMYVFEKFEEALDFGKIIALKFNLDVLDATVKGNFKWLDK